MSHLIAIKRLAGEDDDDDGLDMQLTTIMVMMMVNQMYYCPSSSSNSSQTNPQDSGSLEWPPKCLFGVLALTEVKSSHMKPPNSCPMATDEQVCTIIS